MCYIFVVTYVGEFEKIIFFVNLSGISKTGYVFIFDSLQKINQLVPEMYHLAQKFLTTKKGVSLHQNLKNRFDYKRDNSISKAYFLNLISIFLEKEISRHQK